MEQFLAFFRGLTLQQRFLLLGGTGLVAGTLWVFVALLGKADYKPLYSGMVPAEAQSLTRRLAEKNIPFELSSDGTSVRVPADQLDKTRLDLAAQGPLQSGRLGFELFDKPNWGGSDFAEKVNYQRALEGELERTIQSIREVEAVRVHLVMPRESLFTEQEREAKAAVVVKLRGARLADDAVASITNLVASAVDSLKPENVTVVDAAGNVPLTPGRRGRHGGSSGGFEAALAQKIVATLSPVVGEQRVKASVTVEEDVTSTEDTQETYDPNSTVVLSSQKTEERMGPGAGPSGVPGTASNVPSGQQQPAATPKPSGLDPGQVLRSESQTYAVSKVQRHILQPAGRLKRIAAAVLIDDAVDVKEENGQKTESRRKRTPEEMKQIQELAMAAIGFDAARGDRLAVENLSFQELPVERPVAPTVPQRVVREAERWVGLLRYVGLAALFGVIYLLLLRPVKKQVLMAIREIPARLASANKSAAALAAGSAAALAGASAAGEEAELMLQQELTETTSDVKRATVLKKHLVDKVKQEPAATARLIQNWIRKSEVRP
ncbi:MAG: flagellar M-ring protein FliF [Acidobacteria bacterium]|nr:flagellar M-ring protein FliF [Acidobacteriota bacterium]MBI3663013.1 flagellar M-ring protein FliF [Acidobacteriota bacterium]